MKTAVLIGSSGNLGPIWHSQLEVMGYEVFCMDVSLGYSVEKKLYFDLFDTEVLQGRTPEVILYNAALDFPPSKGGFHKDFDKIVNVNLCGANRAAEKFMPRMAKQGEGVFIFVGSIQGFIASNYLNYPEGYRKPAGYGASKAGGMNYIKNLANEYGAYGLRAVCMAYGAVDTPKLLQGEFRENYKKSLPLPQFVSESDLRATLRYCIDCKSLTGETVLVDNGYVIR